MKNFFFFIQGTTEETNQMDREAGGRGAIRQAKEKFKNKMSQSLAVAVPVLHCRVLSTRQLLTRILVRGLKG